MKVIVTVEFTVEIPSDCDPESITTNVIHATFEAIHHGRHQNVAEGYDSYETTGIHLVTQAD
jgi:hypothetical protein